jgi:predicted secreted protein
MANLCSPCQAKTASHITGNCRGKKNGNPCNATILSMDYKLCDTCSTATGQCKWCLQNLNGTSTATHTQTTGIPGVVVRDADNGRTFKKLNVNDQVHIVLIEDTWSGAQWDIKTTGYGLTRQIGSQFTADPNNQQYGTRTFIIDVKQGASGKTGDIEMHEVQRSYGYGWYGSGGGYTYTPLPNGKKFKVSVQVI